MRTHVPVEHLLDVEMHARLEDHDAHANEAQQLQRTVGVREVGDEVHAVRPEQQPHADLHGDGGQLGRHAQAR